MSGQNTLAQPQGGGTPARVIPPLPEGIPFLPPQPTRWELVGVVALLVVVGVGGLIGFRSWYSDYDKNRMDPVVRQAVMDHAAKGARFPVTLWSGPRILELELVKSGTPTKSQAARGGQAATCGLVNVIDPVTGAKDPKYASGYVSCVVGVVKQAHR